jgi:cell division protein ZipA
MENIRWILLLIGILLVAGIYMIGRLQVRGPGKSKRRRNRSRRPHHNTAPDLDGDRFDNFVDDELDTMGRLIAEDEEYPQDDSVKEINREPAASAPADTVFSLFVIAPASVPFRGPVLLGALAEAQLEFGDMQIFHRVEVAGNRERVLFSVANIREPGIFDLSAMESFTSEGLALFMQVPGDVDAGKAFDAMVESANILAESLGGNVCDAARNALTQQSISHMREEVINCQLHQRVAQTAS